MFETYLLPEDDGLPTRESQSYVHYKLNALKFYLEVTNTAMRAKPWAARYYIDLQAGPGKNRVGDTYVLGSPLIALTAPHPATHFRFNELDPSLNRALRTRVGTSPLRDQIKITQGDLNVVVDEICDEIYQMDRSVYGTDRWSTLNVAFLDPEGLELHWDTVAKLARLKRMDLIINFSTSGILRVAGTDNTESVDRFFGTTDWRPIYDSTRTGRRRALIDFYRKRLEAFDYNIDIDPDLGGDYISVNNSRNVEVYSMIFASKSELGDKFWKQAAKSAKPPRLPGF